jgi:hypothetical protein
MMTNNTHLFFSNIGTRNVAAVSNVLFSWGLLMNYICEIRDD